MTGSLITALVNVVVKYFSLSLHDEKVTGSLNKVSFSKCIFIATENLLHWFSEQISSGRHPESHLLHTMQRRLLEQKANTVSLTEEGKYQQNRLKTLMAHG